MWKQGRETLLASLEEHYEEHEQQLNAPFVLFPITRGNALQQSKKKKKKKKKKNQGSDDQDANVVRSRQPPLR